MASLQREIDQRLGKHKELNQSLVESFDSTLELAAELAVFERSGSPASSEDAEQIARSYAELEALVARHMAGLAEARDSLRGADGRDLAELFAAPTAGGVEASELSKQRLDTLKKRMWEARHPDEAFPELDGDLMVVARGNAGRDLLDPITKKPLEDPVKNRNCGHFYSRAAIEEHIKASSRTTANRQAKCPVAGCSAKLSARALEPAPEMARLVAQAARDGTLPQGLAAASAQTQMAGGDEDVMQL